jgi:hypothetical protein
MSAHEPVQRLRRNHGVNHLATGGRVVLTLAKDVSLHANAGHETFSKGSQLSYAGGLQILFSLASTSRCAATCPPGQPTND